MLPSVTFALLFAPGEGDCRLVAFEPGKTQWVLEHQRPEPPGPHRQKELENLLEMADLEFE